MSPPDHELERENSYILQSAWLTVSTISTEKSIYFQAISFSVVLMLKEQIWYLGEEVRLEIDGESNFVHKRSFRQSIMRRASSSLLSAKVLPGNENVFRSRRWSGESHPEILNLSGDNPLLKLPKEEEVVGIITMEDVIEEILKVRILIHSISEVLVSSSYFFLCLFWFRMTSTMKWIIMDHQEQVFMSSRIEWHNNSTINDFSYLLNDWVYTWSCSSTDRQGCLNIGHLFYYILWIFSFSNIWIILTSIA